jgi:hypothetical protein
MNDQGFEQPLARKPRSGFAEQVPYSLSRYTDLPGSTSKWRWFEECLAIKQMIAFDPRTGVPSVWSLAPEDTLSLVFWTKDPSNLIASQLRLQPYNVVVHMTATGWREVEKGAPTIEEAGRLLVEACRAFSRVRWRFSPIPLISDQMVIERFKRLLDYAMNAGLTDVFVSFLQPNDMLPETRSAGARFELLNRLSEVASPLRVNLCKDDRSLDDWQGAQFELAPCVPMSDFMGRQALPLESCECVTMVDPFTINESCCFSCMYCYAGDRALTVKKRNSVRGLPVVYKSR